MNIKEIYRLGISPFKLSINKSAWGLEIGEKGLKAVKASFRDGELFVDAIDRIDYSSIGHENRPKVSEPVEEAVRLFKERNLINNSDKVIVSLSGKMILSRFFTLPPIKKNRINDVLKFELRKQVPFGSDEIIWDYQLLNGNGAVNKDIKVVLFATKKGNIYDLLPGLSSLRVNLDAIQIAPVAIYNLVRLISDSNEDAIVINVEKGNTDFIVVGKSKYWNRSIPVTEVNIALIREIQRSIGYYTSISKGAKPDILFLMGDVFDNDKIKFVEENLECKVRFLNLLDKIRVFKDVGNTTLTNNNICGFETALGLTIHGLNLGEIKINLLPHGYVKERQSSRQKIFICVVLISIFLGLFTQNIKNYITWRPLSNGVDTATEALKEVNKLERAFKIIEKRTKVEEDNLKVLKAIGNQGLFLIEAINKIINSIPEDVFLVNIESVWDLPNYGKKDKAGGKGVFVTKGEMTFKNDDKPKETLRIIVKGESYAPKVSYIEEKVKKPIANLTLLNQQIPVFSNVTLVQGSVKHVTVLENNGTEEDANGDTQSQPISFEIKCIANTLN
jgi:type IV pilus assembly protein PilM